MGCGNSKNKISSAATPRPDAPTTRPPKSSASGKRGSRRSNSKTIQVKAKAAADTNSDLEGDNIEIPSRNSKKSKKNRSWGSRDSLGSVSENDEGNRGFSATSKVSAFSQDSGMYDEDCMGYNDDMITENSDPDKVAKIEGGFETPRGLELGVMGQAVPQRFSAKDKDRLDEQRVLAALREEGLIHRPMTRAQGGVGFEIIAQEDTDMFGVKPMRPARLEKLEKKRKKKRKPRTQEEIQAKLDRAEERRKEAEQQRLAKINALNKSDVLTALDSFENSIKAKEHEVETKLDQATLNRQKRMEELRDKLRAKQEHAEMVRRRKKLAPIATEESPREATPVPRITEDTPVGKSSHDPFRNRSADFDETPVGY